MIHKLPRWVWFGGAVLAFIAGMVNAVGLLSFKHEAVSHLTGTVTLFGIDAAEGKFGPLGHLGGLVLSFLFGASLSGMIIKDSTLKLGQHYSAALGLESLLLFASVPLLQANIIAGEYLASCACGLQNAMASTYSGAIIRTTHVTGLITDLGILLGHLMRGLKTDRARIRLCLILISSFVGGAFVSQLLHAHFQAATLCFPAAITGLAAVGHAAMSHFGLLREK